MSLSKDLIQKHLPLIWDRLTSGSDVLAITTLRKRLLNNQDNFMDYNFLEEELKGKSGYGITYEEFQMLILGNTKKM